MVPSLNKVFLLGTLKAAPEVRVMHDKTLIVTLRLATTERTKDKSGEWRERDEYHTVIAYRQLADRIRALLRNGSQIMVEGRIRTQTWTGPDNNKRHRVEIVASEIQLIGEVDHPESTKEAQAPAESESSMGDLFPVLASTAAA